MIQTVSSREILGFKTECLSGCPSCFIKQVSVYLSIFKTQQFRKWTYSITSSGVFVRMTFDLCEWCQLWQTYLWSGQSFWRLPVWVMMSSQRILLRGCMASWKLPGRHDNQYNHSNDGSLEISHLVTSTHRNVCKFSRNFFYCCPVLTKFGMCWKVLVILPNVNFIRIHSTILELLRMDREIDRQTWWS
jgi:hypothetical protein